MLNHTTAVCHAAEMCNIGVTKHILHGVHCGVTHKFIYRSSITYSMTYSTIPDQSTYEQHM